MWYTSCSTGAHWIPSTVAPCDVVAAGASSGPFSSGMPSGPGAFPLAAVVEVVAVVAGAVVELAVAVVVDEDAAGAWELEEPLPPHAVSSDATTSDITSRARRPGMAASNGSWRYASRIRAPLITCERMSDSAPPADLPMTTALDLPGMRIRENLGVCYGLVVRSMGFTGGVAASFKGLRRGEIPEYTQLLEDSRRHAIDRMSDNARLMGADAIVAVRFDSSEIGQQFTEIVAYGTAVKVDRSA